jgi:hypothetical protein
MLKGRGIYSPEWTEGSRGTTFVAASNEASLFHRHCPAEALCKGGLISYPMVTEETGFPLTQKPSHRAQPPKLSCRGPESKILLFLKILHTSMTYNPVNIKI